eukprot:g11285.t1
MLETPDDSKPVWMLQRRWDYLLNGCRKASPDAEDALQELQDQEAIRQRLCEMVNQAIQQRELSGLKQALLEAQSELLGEERIAEQICVELEEEARRQAEAALRRRSAEALVAAVDAGDWDRIQQALEEGLAAGLAEDKT